MSVIFDQLRISDDGKKMYINLHVNTASYFDNVYLDSITIMTADKVSETNPFNPTDDSIYYKEIEGTEKELNIVLPDEDVSNWNYDKPTLSGDLFFVYVKTKTVGVPDPCIPCVLDECYTLGVTFDETLLYQKSMDYTKDLLQGCEVPVGFTDFILQWNAFKAAVETEHYVSAITFWKLLFDSQGNATTYKITKPCGCHG
jgi:hypothetical protein